MEQISTKLPSYPLRPPLHTSPTTMTLTFCNILKEQNITLHFACGDCGCQKEHIRILQNTNELSQRKSKKTRKTCVFPLHPSLPFPSLPSAFSTTKSSSSQFNKSNLQYLLPKPKQIIYHHHELFGLFIYLDCSDNINYQSHSTRRASSSATSANDHCD